MPNLAWNFGVPGQNTAYMLSTELPLLLAMNPLPSVVSILGGTNDVKEGVSPATTVANLTAMVNQLKAAGITPILCTIPPNNTFPTQVQATNAAISAAASSLGVTLVDFYTGLAQSNGTYQTQYLTDGTHPNIPGYTEMAHAFIAQTASIYGGSSVWLPTAAQDRVNLVPDPLMASAPTSWVQTFYSNFAAAPAITQVAGASPVVGDWMQAVISVDDTAGHYAMFGPGNTANAAAGDQMLFVARFNTSGISALSPMSNQQGLSIFTGATDALDPFVTPVFEMQSDCTNCIVAVEYTQPALPASGDNVGVQIYFTGGSTSGTVTLQLAQVAIVDLTASAVNLDSTGNAQFDIPAGTLPLGIDTLAVKYTPGSASSSIYNGASGTNSVTVTQVKTTPEVVLTPSASSITTAQTLAVSVALDDSPAPTGTVTLTSGSYNSAAVSLDGGTAQFNIPAGSLTAGTDTLTASYSGDSNYNASTGTAQVIVTTAVNPSFAVSGTAVTVAPGATTANASTITVTPAGGFTGSVALTAAVTSSPTGSQYPPTLSFGSTSPANITGATAVTATLTIFTTSASSSATASSKRAHGSHRFAASGAAVVCALLFGLRRRRRRWQTMIGMLVFLVALTAGVSACGGGGGGGVGTGTPGTTAGAYTITVTGTSGTDVTVGTLSLTVQ
jgi:hypothetical protein